MVFELILYTLMKVSSRFLRSNANLHVVLYRIRRFPQTLQIVGEKACKVGRFRRFGDAGDDNVAGTAVSDGQETDGGMYQLFQGHYWDEEGNEHDIWQWSNTYGERDPETGMSTNEDTMFTTNFPLEGFEGSVIYMEPIFSHEILFDEPLSISIK